MTAIKEVRKNLYTFFNIAASIQKATEYWILKIVKSASKITNCNNICMAGGVALNSLANATIKRNGINLFIQPAAGDAGGVVGAAMKFYYSRNNRSKINNFNVYTGKKVSVLEINNELENLDLINLK